MRPKNHPQKGFANMIVFIIFLLTMGGAVLYFKNFPATPAPAEQPTEQPQAVETQKQVPANPLPPTEEVAVNKPQPSKEIKNVATSGMFSDKLNLCTKYKTKFVHLLTKETLEKEILGIIDGKCNYVEQMPNGGKMECKFTESARKAVAAYYKDVEIAESVGTSIKVNLSKEEQKTSYTIDGKVVSNPLQEATKIGTCIISGY